MNNEFSNTYKTFSNSQLVEVLENSDNYLPLAVEAAEKELTSRQLSSEQMIEIKMEIERRSRATRKKETVVSIENRVMAVAQQILETLNPIGISQTPEKTIRIVCWVLAIGFLYHLFSNLDFLLVMLSDISNWDISTVWWFIPYIFLPSMIYLLIRKLKGGWIMLSIWLTYTIVSAVFSYAMELKLPEPSSDEGISQFLEEMTPRQGFLYYLGTSLIFGALLYWINTRSIMEMFRINRPISMLSIFLAILFVTVQWYFF